MVSETISTSTQGVNKQSIGGTNSLDLVNNEIPSNTSSTVGHKGLIDQIASFVAKITGNPDPFTGNANVTSTANPEFQASTQTPTPELKQDNKTITAPVAEDSGLFGKFTGVLGNIGSKVESVGEQALGKATDVVNKGLEKAEKAGEQALVKATDVVNKGLESAEKAGGQAISKVQETANKTTGNITSSLNNFVNLEDGQKNEGNTEIPFAKKPVDQTSQVQETAPIDFFPKDHETEVKTA